MAVVSYGCGTLRITFREEQRLRIFDKGVLRTIFGPNSEKVPGYWRKMHNEDLQN